METSTILVRYGEIALKGKNRHYFEAKFLENIRRSLDGAVPFKTKRLGASYLLQFSELPDPIVYQRLSRVVGLANYAPVYSCPLELETLKREVTAHFPVQDIRTFAIRTRRQNRSYAHDSVALNRELGTAVQAVHPLQVDLDNPDRTCYVEVTGDAFYYYWDRFEGARGLPVGVSGKVMTLLSGGIDSPVAAYLMATRGCLPVYVHFHSAPYTSQASIDKVREVVSLLEEFHYTTRLYLVPFADVQKEIVTHCPAPLRVILYRRFMMRIATALAKREGAHALVTGECVGQVASQTLPNLRSIDDATSLPVFRPLIGLDKDEIVRRARDIGTYEISIQPDQDCCSYLMPDKPATSSRLVDLETAEQRLDLNELVTTVVEKSLLRT